MSTISAFDNIGGSANAKPTFQISAVDNSRNHICLVVETDGGAFPKWKALLVPSRLTPVQDVLITAVIPANWVYSEVLAKRWKLKWVAGDAKWIRRYEAQKDERLPLSTSLAFEPL